MGRSLDLPDHELRKYFKHELPEIRQNYEQQVAQDTFIAISDWYYFAILELVHTQSFTPDPKWIARALGLTVSEVHIAVERLQRLGALQIDESGRWIDTLQAVEISRDHNTAVARKKWQQQTFELALKKISEVPSDKRVHSGMTMAIDSTRVEEARTMITKFRQQMCDFLVASDHRDQVYQLSVALFPLTDIENEEGRA